MSWDRCVLCVESEGERSVVSGWRSAVGGQWSVVSGQRSVVGDQWLVISGW